MLKVLDSQICNSSNPCKKARKVITKHLYLSEMAESNDLYFRCLLDVDVSFQEKN